jgi:hypothetical protein
MRFPKFRLNLSACTFSQTKTHFQLFTPRVLWAATLSYLLGATLKTYPFTNSICLKRFLFCRYLSNTIVS